LFCKLSKLTNILKSVAGIVKGFALTAKHLFRSSKTVRENIQSDTYFSERTDNTSTLRYPHIKLPLPDNSRNQLHVEIDDCIVCDLCAKICPVDCIEIEAIKAVEDIGKTSDGTTKRLHAAQFDIDMAKCMFCGLCTIVCPTECIIMTDEYDVSLDNVAAMNYHFSTMTAEEASRNKIKLAAFEAEKKAAKEAALKATQEKKEEGNV
jgi:NADH-quinone oxidoreductase subunit I